MEENERELIRTRLTKLIRHTHCTPEFLTFFFEKKILTFDEIQEIAGIKVDSEKALKFYHLIQTRTSAFAVLEEGLQKYNQTGTLNVLEGREDLVSEPTLEEIQSRVANLSFERTKTSSQRRNISFDVLPPVFSFTGRTAELEQLHQMVLRSQRAERISVVTQITSVSGLGGIGKTELAKEYVRLYKLEFDGNLLWMNAESEESLDDSFKRLAQGKLNLPIKDVNGRDMPAKSMAEAVYNYFEGIKALFVLDNAEKAPWLKQFMPRIENTQNLFILITSRDREWDRGVEILSLDGLVEDDAVDLIRNGIGINGDDPEKKKSARNLAQNLQCFPLALQQAIAYIYEQRRTRSNYSVEAYIEEFKTKQLELLNYREENTVSVDIFTATTATTWSMTFDKIKEVPNHGIFASLILNVIAYFGADNIRRDLFYRLRITNHWLTLKMLNIASYFGMLDKLTHFFPMVCSFAEIDLVKEEQINEAVRLLVKYSMFNGGDGQNILSVHRLVQSVTRAQLARGGMEEMHLEIANQLLQGSDKNNFPAENIGHALIVWRHAFQSHQIIQGYARQVYQILLKMTEVGHHEEGLKFGNEALVIFKEVLGEDHLICLWIQRSIGLILIEQGYVDKAVVVFQNILTKAKSLYGEDIELSLLTKEDLGNSLSRSGKKQEALQILREVLEQKETMYGESHPSTLCTKQNYGVALVDSENLNEAENIFQRLIEIYMESGAKNSTIVLQLQINLSSIYSRKGDNKKALKIDREVYKKLNPFWTENVDLFAAACSNLGISLNTVGKHEEALKILEGSFERIKERLGSHHASTLEIQQAIGISHQGLGNLNKAHEIFQSVHQAFVSFSGEDSLDTLGASKNVAIISSLVGNHSQALSKFQEIIPKMEALVGKKNWKRIITKWEHAHAIERSGKNLLTALDPLKQAKPALIAIEGEDSPKVEYITENIKRIEKKTETS